MKTMTVEQFNSLSFDFEIIESEHHFENNPYHVQIDEDGNYEAKDCFSSFVTGVCRAKSGEIEIDFGWIANGGQHSYTDAFDFEIELNQDADFEMRGLTLVDEDGLELASWEYNQVLTEKLEAGEWVCMAQGELPKPETNVFDIDEDSDMETYTLEIDNAPAFRFTGELIACVSSSDNNASGSSYSGETGRWTELSLYKTKGGSYVCHQVGRTRWQGERDRFSGQVCSTLEEVRAFFGHKWLAKDLYDQAGIEDTQEIE